MIAPFKTAVVITLLANSLWSEIVSILLKEFKCITQTGCLFFFNEKGRITLKTLVPPPRASRECIP